MLQGFHFVPITIGLFGVGEVLNNAAERYKVQIEEVTRAAKLGLHDITRRRCGRRQATGGWR
jgi:putative tricarboxylic transport membrane protein